MTESLVFIDVNVPMYAAGQTHPYQQPCIWVMTEVAEGRLNAAIDTEIVQEILYRYGALRRWDIAKSMATDLMSLVTVIHPVTTGDIKLAVELFSRYAPQGVMARDIIHAAVMQNNGMTKIISTDEHFDQIEGVVRLDPQALFERP